MEEKIILTELRKGNKEAFKYFYRLYSVEMHEFAYTFLKNKKDAEDVVHDSFVVILNKPDSWSHITDMRGYIFRIVQNQCLAIIRKNNSLLKKEGDYNYYQISSRGDRTTPEILTSINKRETRKKIDWLFTFLSPQRLKAVELVYMEGKSYDEAANIMGIGKESIKTHLRLARNVLKNNLFVLLYCIGSYLFSK